MGISFIETVKNYFTSEFINQSSVSLDESSSSVFNALNAIIPTGLAAVLNIATVGNEGAARVLTMARDAAGYYSQSPNLAKLHDEEKGANLPWDVFGNRESQVSNAVANYAGIKQSSAGSLITLTLPVILGLLGKHAEETNLTASALSGFLSSQKENMINAMPAELTDIAEVFGLGALSGRNADLAFNMRPQTEVSKKRKTWLLPLILIIAVIALLIYFSRGCNRPANSKNISENTSMNVSELLLV